MLRGFPQSEAVLPAKNIPQSARELGIRATQGRSVIIKGAITYRTPSTKKRVKFIIIIILIIITEAQKCLMSYFLENKTKNG